ncbi:nucleotidyltransferase domain-containing protein [Runella zeae]|uniref:nucleotidyltransferase domain-containing protein n=1 Tax=Runella zeae TaxID=94255 RepID=UPI002355E5FE|nr:nucleotidyltransferase domain-containing protein [Runella zeae]
MKINSKDTIADIPVLKIRDLLRDKRASSVRGIAYFLKIDEEEAGRVLKILIGEGYLKEEGEGENVSYSNTTKGNALGLAKAIPSISRAKADEIFNDFMERVKEVNHNDYYLYKVKRVILFGSYLTESATVNDIDIVVETERKESDNNLGRQKNESRSSEASMRGVRFGNILDYLYYPQYEVSQFLKSRSRYLSIHMGYDDILDETESKVVYSS